jgi:hypothetical protein
VEQNGLIRRDLDVQEQGEGEGRIRPGSTWGYFADRSLIAMTSETHVIDEAEPRGTEPCRDYTAPRKVSQLSGSPD